MVGLALRNAWFLVLVSVERFEEGRNSKRGEKNVTRFYELNAVFQFLERERGRGRGGIIFAVLKGLHTSDSILDRAVAEYRVTGRGMQQGRKRKRMKGEKMLPR